MAPPGPERLGPERLGCVLDFLPPADLAAARLAARVFNEASRGILARAATLTLAPPQGDGGCGGGGGGGGGGGARFNGGPGRGATWARFPGLRRLVLRGWGSGRLFELQRMMDGGPELLDGVEAVEAVGCAACGAEAGGACGRCGPLDAPTWAAVLRRAPRATSLRLGPGPGSGALNAALAVLATVAALAPRATEVLADEWPLEAAGAAALAAGMPGLESLSFAGAQGAYGAVTAEARLWAALPRSRLVVLRARGPWMLYPPPAQLMPWPRLRKLAGVSLAPGQAAALARGLPGLQQLLCYPEGPEGAWRGLELPEGVSFGSLTRLQLPPYHGPQDCQADLSAGFAAAAPLARLFPALERLEWTGGAHAWVECDIPGLSRLTHLALAASRRHDECLAAGPAVWDGLGALRRLREVSLHVVQPEVPTLARALPSGLTSLEVGLALSCVAISGGESQIDWGSEARAPLGPRLDACRALEAAAHGKRLLRLRLAAPAAGRLSHASLAALVRCRELSALERLEISHPCVLLHDVSVLAVLPRLTRLAVNLDKGQHGSHEARRLVSDHAARGLEIAIDFGC